MKLNLLNKILERTEMCDIAQECGTDKEKHGYTRLYDKVMYSYKDSEISFLEIGIYQGNSLKLWNRYFRKGKIFAIDNGGVFHHGYNTNHYSSTDQGFSHLENENVKCFNADQKDIHQIKKAFDYFGCKIFDFILDDGSHFQECQQKSLGILFKYLRSGGFYIIEDVIDYSDLKNGSWWNQKRSDCSDSTDFVFSKYLKEGIFESDYMTEDEKKYFLDNIEDIYIFDQQNRNNSPVSGTSKLIVIKKK